jgi:short-chain Z-isoprenyl diphosphate synthase
MSSALSSFLGKTVPFINKINTGFLTRPFYALYEKNLETKLLSVGVIPNHVGFILDGNRRFAKRLGLDTLVGHKMGGDKFREVLGWCYELNIPYITIWVFSSENFSRPKDEVNGLMKLFASKAQEMVDNGELKQLGIRVKFVGNKDQFPKETVKKLHALEEDTSSGNKMLLNVAIGYGGRQEIVDAVQKLITTEYKNKKDIKHLVDQITDKNIEKNLYSPGTPDPDFIIRTSGEVRLSGFMLWQSAYSEYYFCDTYWPALRKVDFLRALRDYQNRQRRFGK